MNATRREIISDMRHRGMTPKEAYEASKDPEFMSQWVRIQVRDQVIDGRPKKQPRPPSWRARLKFLAKLKAIQLQKIEQGKRKQVRKSNFVRELLEKGLNLKQALRIARKRHD